MTLPLLDGWQDDPGDDVPRSVADHLNDIATLEFPHTLCEFVVIRRALEA